MTRGLPLIVIFVVLAAHAGEPSYRSGILKRLDIKDVTGGLPIQTGPGQDIVLPLPFGIDYQFQVQSDMIVYVGMCYSNPNDKRNYGADWVVNDPVEFRVDKDKLMLKRSPKGELRLALLTRLRVLPSKDGAATGQSSVEILRSLVTRQTVPQC